MYINSNSAQQRHQQSGFSLIELMISMALGLIILAGITIVFVQNSQTRREIEKTARQIENGRFALQAIREDLELAGFLSSYVPPLTAPTATALPDPCSVVLSDINSASVLHVQGYDNTATTPSCLSDRKSGTDILVVRRAAACAAGAAGCDAFLTGAPHIQSSDCTQDTQPYILGTAAANFTLRKVDCVSTAEIRRYRTHIYFIANNNLANDGVPTLKRAELGVGAGGTMAFTIVPLVEGIENLQLEYGIDTNNDGVPNIYTADPNAYNTCTGNTCVQNWWNVMSTRVYLLARNTAASSGYTDLNTYTLGLTAAGQANVFGPYGDHIRRQPYNATVYLFNPSLRRQ